MAGSTFDIKIVGLAELTRNLKKSPEVVENILQQAISKSAAVLASHTDSSTVPWITGTLARSFNPVDIGRLYARWYPRVDYARSVQFGAAPSRGRFVPAIGKRLVNGANIGMWPGFKGRHFMEKIRSASVDEINEIFRNALQVIKSELSQ